MRPHWIYPVYVYTYKHIIMQFQENLSKFLIRIISYANKDENVRFVHNFDCLKSKRCCLHYILRENNPGAVFVRIVWKGVIWLMFCFTWGQFVNRHSQLWCIIIFLRSHRRGSNNEDIQLLRILKVTSKAWDALICIKISLKINQKPINIDILIF